MKMILASFAAFISLNTAQATSLHPCTPNIQAAPTIISCVQDELFYSIEITTVMSNPEICQGKNYYETNSASIEVTDQQGKVQNTLMLQNGEFSYKLSSTGDAQFVSRKAGLQLKQCVTPMHGGFSIGN